MFCSKILVAYDESEIAGRALEKAIYLAKMDSSVEIHVIHIIDIPIITGIDQFVTQEIVENFKKHGNEVLDNAREALKALPNKSEAFLLEGKSASNVILDHTKDNGCDLIIIGSRGLSGIRELLGSVSHMVIQQALVPVLVVK
jgi:nucleotide-binding universal stress UspA family protein